MIAPWKKSYDKPRYVIKKQSITWPTKIRIVKAMAFPIVMYGCESYVNHKVGWAPKNWCLWTVVLEKTLESSLDSKESQPVNPKGNQPWTFIGRTDAEGEAPLFRPPAWKSCLIRKDPDAGKERLRAGGEVITDSMDMSLSIAQEIVKDREAWRAVVHGAAKSQTWLSN